MSTAYPLLIAAILAVAATAQLSPGLAPAPAQFSPGPAGLPVPPVAPGPYPGAGAPGPSMVDSCFTYLIGLSDCLTFVEGGSNLTKPDPKCCTELANLVSTQPQCLCELLGNPGQLGIPVDMKRALQLPAVCNVTTPPVSLCAAIGVPIGALPGTPSEAPAPAPALSPGGDEGAAVPTPGGANGSPSNLASKNHLLIGLAALFFTYLY